VSISSVRRVEPGPIWTSLSKRLEKNGVLEPEEAIRYAARILVVAFRFLRRSKARLRVEEKKLRMATLFCCVRWTDLELTVALGEIASRRELYYAGDLIQRPPKPSLKRPIWAGIAPRDQVSSGSRGAALC